VASGREDPAGERGGLPGGAAAAAGRAFACVGAGARKVRLCGIHCGRDGGAALSRQAKNDGEPGRVRRVRPGVASERVARGAGGLRRA
jgi:hypothetical protein